MGMLESLRTDVRGVSTTDVGVRITGDIGWDAWQELGVRLGMVANSTPWWLGDWLTYGVWRYGERYREAVDVTGLDYQTLRGYAMVAGRFAHDRRRPGLSFAHHREVLALPIQQQETVLDKAESDGLGRDEVRGLVAEARKGLELELVGGGEPEPRGEDAPPSATEPVVVYQAVQVRIEADRFERWRKASEDAEFESVDAFIAWCVDLQVAQTVRAWHEGLGQVGVLEGEPA